METHDSGCAAERLRNHPQRAADPRQPGDIPSYQQLAHSWLSLPASPEHLKAKPNPAVCVFFFTELCLSSASCRVGTRGAEDQDAPAVKYTSLICKYVVRAGWCAWRPGPFHKGDTDVFSLLIRVIGEPFVHFPLMLYIITFRSFSFHFAVG